MPLPPAAGLAISNAERKRLVALGRHRSSPRGIVLRIEIVLGAAEGLANRVLARKWGFRRRRTLIPGGTRTAFRAEGEQFSERSDAGSSIVQEVFAFVKENLS